MQPSYRRSHSNDLYHSPAKYMETKIEAKSFNKDSNKPVFNTRTMELYGADKGKLYTLNPLNEYTYIKDDNKGYNAKRNIIKGKVEDKLCDSSTRRDTKMSQYGGIVVGLPRRSMKCSKILLRI